MIFAAVVGAFNSLKIIEFQNQIFTYTFPTDSKNVINKMFA
jgi:hypothetical protein